MKNSLRLSVAAQLHLVCEHRPGVGYQDTRDECREIRHQETVQVCQNVDKYCCRSFSFCLSFLFLSDTFMEVLLRVFTNAKLLPQFATCRHGGLASLLAFQMTEWKRHTQKTTTHINSDGDYEIK